MPPRERDSSRRSVSLRLRQRIVNTWPPSLRLPKQCGADQVHGASAEGRWPRLSLRGASVSNCYYAAAKRRVPRLRKPWRTMLPLPTYAPMEHCAFGHGRFTTGLPTDSPETEVRYCEILAQGVSCADVAGEALTVGGGGTGRRG